MVKWEQELRVRESCVVVAEAELARKTEEIEKKEK